MIPQKKTAFRRPHVAGDKSAVTIDELDHVLQSKMFLTVDWTQKARIRIDDARDLIFGRPDQFDECCNSMEASLIYIVMDAIAEERCENPAKCAEIAKDSKFNKGA